MCRFQPPPQKNGRFPFGFPLVLTRVAGLAEELPRAVGHLLGHVSADLPGAEEGDRGRVVRGAREAKRIRGGSPVRHAHVDFSSRKPFAPRNQQCGNICPLEASPTIWRVPKITVAALNEGPLPGYAIQWERGRWQEQRLPAQLCRTCPQPLRTSHRPCLLGGESFE